MAAPEPDPVDRSGRLVQEHKGYDPRIVSLYFLIAAALLILAAGLAYRQLFGSDLDFGRQERRQNVRRLVMPGPRGTIYDRNGVPLVTNEGVFAVTIDLSELQNDFRREFIRVRTNYRDTGDHDLPTSDDMEQIARASVVQHYLDQVDDILGRSARVDPASLSKHYKLQRLLPYQLITDLNKEEFARLTEHLPVDSPLQVYATSARSYPYGSAASHVLGYVGVDPDVEAEDLTDEDLKLKTFESTKGFIGRDGLEKHFDSELQGKAGYEIFRVDPAGYKVNPPLDKRLPEKGKNLTTSLDIGLQLVAESALGDRPASAVAIDVHTGEVLVLASKPDYDLNAFSPRLLPATVADIEKRGAWTNLATAGLFPPGSTFKTVVTIAGLLSGRLNPTDTSVDCEGSMRIGNAIKHCDESHGELDLREAIAQSCDIYFYVHGIAIGPDAIAAEARRFHLDQPTGIELPGETHRMLVPDANWKKSVERGAWTDGDTANIAIGQGDLRVSPLEMACYAASLARGETTTRPTLLHDPHRPIQHSDPIGLTSDQRAVLLDGMEQCTLPGPHHTAYELSTVPLLEVPGVRICGKTGTAQLPGHLDEAWFICFAPRENPEIAVAVAIEGNTPGETYGGGMEAAPVAALILQRYFANKAHPGPAALASSGGP